MGFEHELDVWRNYELISLHISGMMCDSYKMTNKLYYRKDYRAMRLILTAQSDNTDMVCC